MFVTKTTNCGTCGGTGKVTHDTYLPELNMAHTFTAVVIVKRNPTNKIMGIKELRENLSLGLKEAKELYEYIDEMLRTGRA